MDLFSEDEDQAALEAQRQQFIQQLFDDAFHPTRYDPILELDLCNQQIDGDTAIFQFCLLLSRHQPSKHLIQFGYQARIQIADDGQKYRVLEVGPCDERFTTDLLSGLDAYANDPEFLKRLHQQLLDNKLLNKRITNVALAQIESRFPLLGFQFETPINLYCICV